MTNSRTSRGNVEPDAVRLNLFLIGLAIVRRAGYHSLDLWIGPWGVLIKFHGIVESGEGLLVRIGLDLGRGFVGSAFLEVSWARGGFAQTLEILIGPFGYLERFVQQLHLQKGLSRFLWLVRLGPDGLLFAHTFRMEKVDRFRFLIDESLGPFQSVARLAVDLEWKYKGPARLDGSLLIGPRGYVLRFDESSRRRAPGAARTFLACSVGPGGAVLRALVGLDITARPRRPYFEFSLGPGDRFGYLYRHSGKDAWINGLDLARRQDRFLRIVGFDLTGVAGQPLVLMAMALEGVSGFLAPPAPNVLLNVFVGDRQMGSVRTNEQGWAHLATEPIEVGHHRLVFTRSNRRAAEQSGVARLSILPEDRPVLALRLDEMLVAGWETAFAHSDWASIRVDERLARRLFDLARSYALVYLTRLPIEYMAALRLNLFMGSTSRLPRGMILPSRPTWALDNLTQLPFASPEKAGEDVVERTLKEFRFRGVPIELGLSHLEEDVRMIRNAAGQAKKIPTLEGGDVDAQALLDELSALAAPDRIAQLQEQAADHVHRRRAADRSEFRQKVFRIRTMSGVNPLGGNRIQVFTEAGQAVRAIFEAVDAADRAICLSTMMLGDDAIGSQITDRLIGAAQRGLSVRVLVDQWLSEHSEAFPNANVARLEASPVELRLRKLAHGFARVHKKTITALSDSGKLVAFVGGMNWVDASFGNFGENLGERKLENPERDLFCRVDGPAAQALQEDFLETWAWVSGAGPDPKQRAALAPEQPVFEPDPKYPFTGCSLFVVGNIPGRDRRISDAFLALIHGARRTIRIEQNFPPSNAILHALRQALARGVRVEWIFGARKGPSALLTDNINLNKAAQLFAAGATFDRWDNPRKATSENFRIISGRTRIRTD